MSSLTGQLTLIKLPTVRLAVQMDVDKHTHTPTNTPTHPEAHNSHTLTSPLRALTPFSLLV